MDKATVFTIGVIFIAYLFDFINGFHDAANAIATIVTTKVLSPRQAVVWAAFFNFIAFLVFNLTVAKTVGEGLVEPRLMDAHFILAALVGAISWNLITWYYGLPSSSSHALIGGLAGAALAQEGFSALQYSGFIKVLVGIILSPILGLFIALVLIYGLNYFFVDKHQNKKFFKLAQLGSSAFLSLTHGSNDAQKTMGIIAILLFSSSWLNGPFYVPYWVVISCQAVISLGTLMGGWRIVKTMGTKISQLNPMKGCAAETGAAITLSVATYFGVPISTTHTVTGAITGVGLTKGIQAARWPILKKIFFSWLLTIPAAAIIAAILITLV